MSILVEQVSKLYGEQKALDDVNFAVSSGEVIGFLGPNGAGKSTMMKIISGFIPPNEGKVTVCGHDVLSETLEVKKKVGYLPEHNPLYLDMYVKEYFEFVGSVYKIPNLKARIKEMIDRVGLELEQHKQIGALSKGYRPRVGRAQAMIHDPEVLILDEPTSGLDPNQLVEIRNLISSIGKEKTVMLSTHIMQEVEAICSRVLIINRGKVVADKPVNEIRSTLSSSGYELKVEFSSEVSATELKKIQGVHGAIQADGNNWTLEVSTNEDVRQYVFNYAVEHNNSVLTMQRVEKSMEDVFKELTSL
jgi:ABC-2 type transport system ATP-binding protein